jgi:hypothetical protein
VQANFYLLSSADAYRYQRRRLDTGLNIALPLSLAVVATIAALALGGLGLWLIAGTAIGVAVLAEPRVGLYLVGLSISVDAVDYDPITWPFDGLYRSVPELLVTPVELLVLWTGVCWGIRCLAEGSIQLPHRSILHAGLAMTFLLLAGIANGVNGGADLSIAIWETRALLIVLPVTLIACGLLKERRHVVELILFTIAGLTLMSIDLLWRYLAVIRPNEGGPLEQAFSHDGAMLVGLMAVASGAVILWGPSKKARFWGVLGFLLACTVVMVSRRRAAVVGMEMGFMALGVTLLITNWRRFVIIGPIAIVLGVLYMGAFWNSQNSLGQPARAFRSVFMEDTKTERDRSSDEYRKIEKLNVWWGIQANPLRGHGFGMPYAKPIPMVDLSSFWPFWDYIPHNNILWLWHKGGVLNLMAFFYLIGTATANGVTVARKLKSPALTAMIGTAIAYIVMSVMFGYVDLGLTSPRIMVPLGLTLGLLAAVERAWPNTEGESAGRRLEAS